MEVAVRQRLDEHRPRRGGMRPGRLHRGQDRQRVHPVDDQGRHVVARRADRELLEARGLHQRRGDRVAVVLHQGDEREAPGAGERERLVEGPDRQPAVAHDRHGDAAVAAELGGKRTARSSRNATGDDRARRDAGRRVRQVHRAAPATAQAFREAQDLRHRAPDRGDDLRRRVARSGRVPACRRGMDDETGEHVVVRPVRRGQAIDRGQRERGPGGDRLLADARVERSGHESRVVEEPPLHASDRLNEEDHHRERRARNVRRARHGAVDQPDVRVVGGAARGRRQLDERCVSDGHGSLAFRGAPPRSCRDHVAGRLGTSGACGPMVVW